MLTPQIIRMRVTACSPGDPKDIEYYKANGYEGALNNIAADLKKFPRGTQMRVPGYMERSAPGKYWEVDSAGGSVIRRSSHQGISHVDVKFRSHQAAVKWGSKWMNVEVITPATYAKWESGYQVWEKKREAFLQAMAARDRIMDEYKGRYQFWSKQCEEIRRVNYGY